MKIRIISFTERGLELAERLGRGLDGEAVRCGGAVALQEWTELAFREAEGLVFVGAAGIAVRAVAPHVRSKTGDPAVVAVDETGQYAIPLLSGHLGGANDLARRIAALCGAVPVITTATDLRGVFAVDEWARYQGCLVRNPERIRAVSSALLAGGIITLRSDFPIAGTPPEGVVVTEESGCDVLLSLRTAGPDVLQLIPEIVVLGVGCRRGTAPEDLESAFRTLCAGGGISEDAVRMVCSIDRKADEPGLLEFCRNRGLELKTFTALELQAVPGTYSSSEFVLSVTGADNICERSAVLGSGGTLLIPKTAGNGITMALAIKEPSLQWKGAVNG